jgi:Golgi SNAP receptor complex protein 1
VVVSVQLTAVNDQMGTLPVTATATLHTIQRHRDILQDYVQEFQRTKGNIQARKNREELLGTAKNSSSGLNRRMDFLLKESDHLRK